MKTLLTFLCVSTLLAFAACAHYPDGTSVPTDAGNGSCDSCTPAPDGGGNAPDSGGATPDGGSDAALPDAGGGPIIDAGTDGGLDGGSGGSDAGACGTCPSGETCVDGACVCDGGDSVCRDGKVLLCHYPRRNPDQCRTLCVGYPSDTYDGHKRHGDTDGACLPGCVRP